MKGQIVLILDNNTIGTIDADTCPDLFIELVAAARGDSHPKSGAAASPKAEEPKTAAKPKAGGTFETRTQGGRDALDAVILDALGSMGYWSKVEKLGLPGSITPAQARTSLHRLEEAGHVKRRGQARGTEYLNVAEKGSAAKVSEPASAEKTAKTWGSRARKATKTKKKAPPKPPTKKKAPSKKKAAKKGKAAK